MIFSPPVKGGLQKGGEYMEFLSERITNISELEKLLEMIHIKSQLARKSTCMSDIQALVSDIEILSDSALSFEFRIEKRKIILSE